MPIFTETLPLSLYIHLPWCIRKCPYCDFNSHEVKDNLPEELYIRALMQELDTHLALIVDRPLISIFFGGGTPSLFSPVGIGKIISGVKERVSLAGNAEITLEANPGTIDQANFYAYREAGVNRLSLGIQSFNPQHLHHLGRIHDEKQAMQAITVAKKAGFDNFNIDIMYGLSKQSIAQTLQDIQIALDFNPTHLSWYQLTLEPNTLFYKQRPALPADEMIWEMQCAGQDLLQKNNLQQYEVSAYSLPNKQCVHNKNYWEFGDYLGIGAGAHSKLTDIKTGTVTRFSQIKHPRDYLDKNKRAQQNIKVIEKSDLIFEFMLNALRLTNGFSHTLFRERTGIAINEIELLLADAVKRGLLLNQEARLCPTPLGKQFLNDLIEIFL